MVKNAMVVMIGISEYDVSPANEEEKTSYPSLPSVKEDVENFRHLFKTILNYEWRESKSKMNNA